MKEELEVKFFIESIESFRTKLANAGAELISPEKLYKRIAFHLPEVLKDKNGWGRIRDEGDKITLSIKLEEGDRIEDQKEVCLEIDNVENGIIFLNLLGFKEKAYQETKREKWLLNGSEITIDTWPFLETFIEVEGESVENIKNACTKLGLNYEESFVGPVTHMYSRKYGLTADVINNQTPLIVFNMKNPFEK